METKTYWIVKYKNGEYAGANSQSGPKLYGSLLLAKAARRGWDTKKYCLESDEDMEARLTFIPIQLTEIYVI